MTGIIYKYQNNLNQKIYIGQTIDYKKRLREHKNAAYNINNSDYNLPIHQAIRKYGLEKFSINIIEEIEQSNLNEREKYWINYYDSYKNGYNCTKGGQDGGYNGKIVEVYDLNGIYLKSYPNAKIAAEQMQISYSTIQQVLHKIRPTCKKYQLKYQEDSTPMKPFQSRQGGTKAIFQLDKNDKVIQCWSSIAKASQALNLDSSSIVKCLKGKLKTCGGYKWKYCEVME